MSGTWTIDRELAIAITENCTLPANKYKFEELWPFGNSVMKFNAYDWIGGEEGEILCKECVAYLVASGIRDTQTIYTLHDSSFWACDQCDQVIQYDWDEEEDDYYNSGGL